MFNVLKTIGKSIDWDMFSFAWWPDWLQVIFGICCAISVIVLFGFSMYWVTMNKTISLADYEQLIKYSEIPECGFLRDDIKIAFEDGRIQGKEVNAGISKCNEIRQKLLHDKLMEITK